VTFDRRIVLIVSMAALAVFLYGSIDYHSMPYAGMDLKYYRESASLSPSIAMGIPKPFCYRLLGPWLAGLFPDDVAGFRIVTFLSAVLLAILFYRLLLSMGISPAAGAAAVFFLVMNKHLFGISAWNFFQVKDTLSLVFIAAAMLAMHRGRWPLFSAALLGGALTGELAMIMVPVLFVFLAERNAFCAGNGTGDGRATAAREGYERPAGHPGWVRPALACLPGLAAFAAIRLLVPSSGGIGLIESALRYGVKLRHPMVWYALLANPFIPLTFIPLIFFRESALFLRRNLHLAAYFLLVLASASFGSNNERLMAPAAIAFYALIAFIIDARVLPRGKVWIAILAAAAALSSLHHSIARFPLPERSFTVVLSGGSLLAVTLLFLIFFVPLRRRPGGLPGEKPSMNY
jgi:hypothetical protein